MPVKKKPTPTVNLTFRIVLDVGLDVSGMTLEEALAHARTLGVTDILDLSGLDHNESSIEVRGAWTHGGL